MTIRVEFFGVPRARAAVDMTTMDIDTPQTTLGDVVLRLSQQFPELARECFQGPRLQPHYTVNLQGERFVNDPETPVRDGQSLLIMSADAGG